MSFLKRPKWIFLILGILFVLPGIAAYVFFLHPSWLRGQPTNHGVFLKSEVTLPIPKASDKQWHIVLWVDKTCSEDCFSLLERMAKVRLALGRHFYDISLDVLLGAEATVDESKLQPLLTGSHDRVIKLTKPEQQARPVLRGDYAAYLVNPSGYFLLTYDTLKNPGALYHDLKHLMSVRQQ